MSQIKLSSQAQEAIQSFVLLNEADNYVFFNLFKEIASGEINVLYNNLEYTIEFDIDFKFKEWSEEYGDFYEILDPKVTKISSDIVYDESINDYITPKPFSTEELEKIQQIILEFFEQSKPSEKDFIELDEERQDYMV